MSPRQKARLIFSLALLLLISSGIATSFSIVGLVNSTKWVTHTYDVKQSISKIESVFALAGRTRARFVASGDASAREQYNSAITLLQSELQDAERDISDNPVQRENVAQLQLLVNKRIEVFTSSINTYISGKTDPDQQLLFNAQSLQLADDSNEVMSMMQDEEDRLLVERLRVSDRLFKVTVAVLSTMFLSSLILFVVHYRMLTAEGAKREESEENARRVSAQLLRVQDHERRKFSRELHDGLGQTLAVVKWTLSSLLEKHPDDPSIAECVKSVDEAILGTRTISHLLHPPLLDEAGFESAARWFVEGFSQRSGIPVSLTIQDAGRLPRSVELALFRVLQESLTNIHKHSKSPRAEVSLRPDRANVILRVKDFGDGLPEETLENFVHSGTRVGVGLAGMRERIREQGGQFRIDSNGAGTTIEVSLPRAGRPSFESEFTDTSIT
ncbi:MAG: CHASE3 domain-containing protein [Candidatus Acidiferrales bacterium]